MLGPKGGAKQRGLSRGKEKTEHVRAESAAVFTLI